MKVAAVFVLALACFVAMATANYGYYQPSTGGIGNGGREYLKLLHLTDSCNDFKIHNNKSKLPRKVSSTFCLASYIQNTDNVKKMSRLVKFFFKV